MATPSAPDGPVELAGSPLADPNPLVLLGTLLFALAAAAGQVFRGDLLRRSAGRLDGARRVAGHGGGPSVASEAPTTWSQASGSHAGGPHGYDTASFDGPSSQTDDTLADAPTGSTAAPDAAPTVAGPSADGLGGRAGGLDGLAKSAPGGFDGLAKGLSGGFDGVAKSMPGGLDSLGSAGPNGFEASGATGGHQGTGFDVARHAVGHTPDVPTDALPGSSGPADWSAGQAPAGDPSSSAAADGSLGGSAGRPELARAPSTLGHELGQSGLGGAQGGDGLARGIGGSGDALAKGFGPSADPLAQASGPSGGAGAGLGGDHGLSGAKAAVSPGTPPSSDFASLQAAGGVVDAPLPNGAGGQAELAESLDALARSLPPADGATLPDAGLSAAAETVVGGSPPGPGPSWLGAGALARAPRTPLLERTFRCPACQRVLSVGHRFCGYCGEPLDRTLA